MTADIFGSRARASFTWTEIDGVVVIYDQDGGCSVTNDAENVIAEIAQQLPALHLRKAVIYRDTDGIFDGLAVDSNNSFAGFYPVRETDLIEALRKVKDVSE